MSKKRILVFPCGSEIGLEIYRAMRYSTHFTLAGASSVDDHGKFVYEEYYGGLPFADHPDFIKELAALILKEKIDALYPTMDKVIYLLKSHEQELGCTVIASPPKTAEICYSKKATYSILQQEVLTPRVFLTPEEVETFPVFSKPDKGYGSRGARRIDSAVQLASHLQQYPDSIITTYLPGAEYTVDCFTDQKGELLFVGPRQRRRIMNGISVNTATYESASPEFSRIAGRINSKLSFRGAWFFQLKENESGELVLMEIASRFAGTSSVHRAQGVNFAMLSVFDAFGWPVSITPNTFQVEVDRALDNRYKLNLNFQTAYIDLDDTLIVDDHLNLQLVALIYQFIGEGKKVVLLTKHARNVAETLSHYRISQLFDEIIHIEKHEHKSGYIREPESIFIDDSFAERKEVAEKLKIPVFAPDAVEALIK